MTKKVIVLLLFLLLVAGLAVWFYLKSETYKLYREAEKLYEEKKYYEAYDKVLKSLSYYKFNKKSLVLKAKLYKIIKSENDYKKALKLFKEARKSFFEEDYETAKNYIVTSYELLINIPPDVPVKPEADKLLKQVSLEMSKYENIIPEKYIRKALTLSAKGDYIGAYEYLERLGVENEKIKKLKMDFAYKIGNERYTFVMSHKGSRDKTYINDAIYWLSKIDKLHPKYMEAQKELKVLKSLLSNTNMEAK
ncbi:conserved hypothetical protein [Deferribacter desulfuricans SSM1]|uniref:Uncharacterized protein n=1 Tax=Deferribacter desulfuricans (strain DSM 14783 / JCM 11476 / NBRC 101012 / SSM1) TaxID=639282 RepID=D3PE30_DEFDS|nr:hypothetical protein [Deferribacter desulfuricans]BAI80853.1 conserved hypothetical protein [Deferribacter desulfuricans SSM1]